MSKLGKVLHRAQASTRRNFWFIYAVAGAFGLAVSVSMASLE